MKTYPQIMSGVPTGYLTPIIPAPKPLVATVGIEIEPGLGISLDGNALLVGPSGKDEKLVIQGHLEYGLPVRNFEVTRQGNRTMVDGHHDHQDYILERRGNRLQVEGETPLESFQTIYAEQGFEVQSSYSSRSYKMTQRGELATVRQGSGDGLTYQIRQQGNRTTVRASQGDGNFSLERRPDGTVFIDGSLNVQDFTLTPTAEGGWLLSGLYPHQSYRIERLNL